MLVANLEGYWASHACTAVTLAKSCQFVIQDVSLQLLLLRDHVSDCLLRFPFRLSPNGNRTFRGLAQCFAVHLIQLGKHVKLAGVPLVCRLPR